MPRRRAPVERLVDLAVAVPVSSVVAARRLTPVLVRAARTLARRSNPAKDVGATSHAAATRKLDDPVADTADLADDEQPIGPDAETPPAGAGVLPIDGYDQLAARQILDRLASLTPSELDAVEAHERAHRGRSTVLGRIAQLRA